MREVLFIAENETALEILGPDQTMFIAGAVLFFGFSTMLSVRQMACAEQPSNMELDSDFGSLLRSFSCWFLLLLVLSYTPGCSDADLQERHSTRCTIHYDAPFQSQS